MGPPAWAAKRVGPSQTMPSTTTSTTTTTASSGDSSHRRRVRRRVSPQASQAPAAPPSHSGAFAEVEVSMVAQTARSRYEGFADAFHRGVIVDDNGEEHRASPAEIIMSRRLDWLMWQWGQLAQAATKTSETAAASSAAPGRRPAPVQEVD